MLTYLRFAHPGNTQGQGDVVEGDQVGEQTEILEHHADAPAQQGNLAPPQAVEVAAEQVDAAARGSQRHVHQPQQRGLAGAARAHQEVERAWRQREGGPVDDFRSGAIAHADVLEQHQCLGIPAEPLGAQDGTGGVCIVQPPGQTGRRAVIIALAPDSGLNDYPIGPDRACDDRHLFSVQDALPHRPGRAWRHRPDGAVREMRPYLDADAAGGPAAAGRRHFARERPAGPGAAALQSARPLCPAAPPPLAPAHGARRRRGRGDRGRSVPATSRAARSSRPGRRPSGSTISSAAW